MFSKVVRAIKKGDLDKLKEILEKEPDVLNMEFQWGTYFKAGLLHIAASCHQPEIIKFLVTEKGMNIFKKYHGATPLAYAVVKKGAYQAAETLLSLGADPCLINLNDCKDQATKELLRSAQQEQQRKKEEIERQRAEAAQREAAARIAGTWKPVSDHEIIFERDLPGQGLCLRKIFDFAVNERLSITKDLQDGGMSQETKLFKDISDDEGKAMIDEARAQLDKANGVAQKQNRLKIITANGS